MVTVKEAINPHRIIYGKTRVGGTIVYAETTSNNDFLHLVIVVAGHEVNNITKIFFNEDEVPLTQDGSDSNGVARLFPSSGNEYEGKARIKKHLGSDAQVADADLVSEITQWTTNHRIRGKAYVYVRLNFDNDVYPMVFQILHVKYKVKKYLIQELLLQLFHLTQLYVLEII